MRQQWSGAVFATGILAAIHGVAMAQGIEAVEGPFTGGAFDRAPSPPAITVPKPVASEPRVPLYFDADGNSNELIASFNYDQPGRLVNIATLAKEGDRDALEHAVVQSIEGGDRTTKATLIGAEHARLLTEGYRLSADARGALPPGHPRESLERYVILRYPTVKSALNAMGSLQQHPAITWISNNQALDLSWTPAASYFPINAAGAGRYQWGLHAMNLPSAWDITKGHGYVGVPDAGIAPGAIHPGLQANYRPQFSYAFPATASRQFHGTHVLGIIGAAPNANGYGTSGGCPTCSIASWSILISGSPGSDPQPSLSELATAITRMVDFGVQVLSVSQNHMTSTCTEWQVVCAAVAYAAQRDVLMVASTGNYGNGGGPTIPANLAQVLPVAAAQNDNPSQPSFWSLWSDSRLAGVSGVVGPGKSIVSTVPAGVLYNIPYKCSDASLQYDESGVVGDGFGSCTGTSMAAPHVAALAGMLRSINPRLSYSAVRSIIRASGNLAAAPTVQLGSGMPNARTAVDAVVAQTPNRLTPLFALVSDGRRDYFYTTAPQMASAALHGSLRPMVSPYNHLYVPVTTTAITGYSSFPDHPPFVASPRADAWIFTTPANPKIPGGSLVPLYRLSWKCGDPTPNPPAVCSSYPGHMDTTYTADTAGVDAYKAMGYQLDGIEGYIYPKNMTQPTGTERLMRKYHPGRDDHAIFPEGKLATMTSLGFTQNSGSDWLGYVYPNTNGSVPAIQ